MIHVHNAEEMVVTSGLQSSIGVLPAEAVSYRVVTDSVECSMTWCVIIQSDWLAVVEPPRRKMHVCGTYSIADRGWKTISNANRDFLESSMRPSISSWSIATVLFVKHSSQCTTIRQYSEVL